MRVSALTLLVGWIMTGSTGWFTRGATAVDTCNDLAPSQLGQAIADRGPGWTIFGVLWR